MRVWLFHLPLSCGQLNGGATGAASSAAITSAATAASSASSAAVSSSAVSGASRASGSAVAVTEAATQPINVTAWAPEGFTPTLTYGIAATGGVNTTIGAALAVTTTDSIGPFTATVTGKAQGVCQILNQAKHASAAWATPDGSRT